MSLLYGAKAHNLYKVVKREAIRHAEKLPPWPVITAKESGKTYYFPYRLALEPIREFAESLVRREFAYVAENLLLRGGYRRTHFQADQTTLQSASQMGNLARNGTESLDLPRYETFVPCFARNREQFKIPEVMPFNEFILQAAIRRYLSHDTNLSGFLGAIGVQRDRAATMEPLGEKALLRGHIDILLKERVPIGSALTVPIEVKLRAAQPKDVEQIASYVEELGPECTVGVLVAEKFAKRTIGEASSQRIKLVKYALDIDSSHPLTFEMVCQTLSLEPVS